MNVHFTYTHLKYDSYYLIIIFKINNENSKNIFFKEQS